MSFVIMSIIFALLFLVARGLMQRSFLWEAEQPWIGWLADILVVPMAFVLWLCLSCIFGKPSLYSPIGNFVVMSLFSLGLFPATLVLSLAIVGRGALRLALRW